MRVNRGLLFWGVALLTAGAIALAVQAGILGRDTVGQVWRLWPVVLIAIGLSILASRSPFAVVGTLVAALVVGGAAGSLLAGAPFGVNVCGSGEATQRSSASGTFTSSASVSLDLSCGDLDLGVAGGTGWILDAGRSGGAEPQVSSGDSSLRVETPEGGWAGLGDRHEWAVTLPADVDLDTSLNLNAAAANLDLGGGAFGRLDVDVNAGDMTLDLGDARIDNLRINGNAVSFNVLVDGGTTASGSMQFNAGSIDICAADGADVAITVSGQNVTFSHNLDASDLARTGDTWRTPGGTGTAAVDVRIGGNATSLTYNPSGGC